MKNLSKLVLAAFSLMIMLSINVSAQEVKAEKQILIKNVSIFDGNSEKLITGKDVVVEGNKIKSIVSSGGDESTFDEVIDGKGGYLSPGIIDAHCHAVMGGDEITFINGDQNYVQLFAAMQMGEMLLRGVTTIRDAGGNTFGLKKAIDDGITDGPRIYPSGAIISQYSGHEDFRAPVHTSLPKEWGGTISIAEKNGHALLANGPDQVMMAVRQQLFLGATQIKLTVGGGVSSFEDPLYVNEYTAAEIKAAVDAAADYGTYVMTHVFNEVGVKRAIESGVKTIEHGHLMNEEDAKLMSEKGVILSTQCQVFEQLKPVYTDPIRKGKLEEAMTGMDNMFKLAKKYNVKVVYGTDLLFSPEGRKEQLKDLTLRKQWYTSPEIMIQATGTGGEVVGLCGKRNPYGKVGVIEEGAMADILIYSKNPLEDVTIVEDYDNNLKLIIKDGKTFKNTL